MNYPGGAPEEVTRRWLSSMWMRVTVCTHASVSSADCERRVKRRRPRSALRVPPCPTWVRKVRKVDCYNSPPLPRSRKVTPAACFVSMSSDLHADAEDFLPARFHIPVCRPRSVLSCLYSARLRLRSTVWSLVLPTRSSSPSPPTSSLPLGRTERASWPRAWR